MESFAQKIDELIAAILEIPGNKIVTLVDDTEQSFVIDISANKEIGYIPEHLVIFRVKLRRALAQQGGMIIREFLPFKVKKKMPNGKVMWIPEKNLYGVVLGQETWLGMSAADVQMSHQTDAKTGEFLKIEDGVHFKAFPIGSLSTTPP